MEQLVIILSVVILVLAVASLGVGVTIPFLLWKVWKLETKLEALDETLAEALTGVKK